MKNNEKQIKLLTKRISKIQNKGVKDIPNFTNIFIDNQELAEELLKYYQPKLSKDSVVISKKEYESLKRVENEKDRLYEIKLDLENQLIEKGWTDYEGADEIEKRVSEETAGKIINPLLDIEVKDGDYKQFFLDVCGKLEELADKHGVEIKE